MKINGSNLYIGITYMSQNKSCTIGNPHPTTGRHNLAVTIKPSLSLDELKDDSSLHDICTTKKQYRKYRQGLTTYDFEGELESILNNLYLELS